MFEFEGHVTDVFVSDPDYYSEYGYHLGNVIPSRTKEFICSETIEEENYDNVVTSYTKDTGNYIGIRAFNSGTGESCDYRRFLVSTEVYEHTGSGYTRTYTITYTFNPETNIWDKETDLQITGSQFEVPEDAVSEEYGDPVETISGVEKYKLISDIKYLDSNDNVIASNKTQRTTTLTSEITIGDAVEQVEWIDETEGLAIGHYGATASSSLVNNPEDFANGNWSYYQKKLEVNLQDVTLKRVMYHTTEYDTQYKTETAGIVPKDVWINVKEDNRHWIRKSRTRGSGSTTNETTYETTGSITKPWWGARGSYIEEGADQTEGKLGWLEYVFEDGDDYFNSGEDDYGYTDWVYENFFVSPLTLTENYKFLNTSDYKTRIAFERAERDLTTGGFDEPVETEITLEIGEESEEISDVILTLVDGFSSADDTQYRLQIKTITIIHEDEDEEDDEEPLEEEVPYEDGHVRFLHRVTGDVEIGIPAYNDETEESYVEHKTTNVRTNINVGQTNPSECHTVATFSEVKETTTHLFTSAGVVIPWAPTTYNHNFNASDWMTKTVIDSPVDAYQIELQYSKAKDGDTIEPELEDGVRKYHEASSIGWTLGDKVVEYGKEQIQGLVDWYGDRIEEPEI